MFKSSEEVELQLMVWRTWARAEVEKGPEECQEDSSSSREEARRLFWLVEGWVDVGKGGASKGRGEKPIMVIGD
jgi:hypothetical protein